MCHSMQNAYVHVDLYNVATHLHVKDVPRPNRMYQTIIYLLIRPLLLVRS